MLIPSHNNGYCRHSASMDGDCCCNCKWRALSVIDRFPLGYYCIHPLFEREVTFIGYHGHSMCEMHERTDCTVNIDDLEIVVEDVYREAV